MARMKHRWIGQSENGETVTLHRYKGKLNHPKRTKEWFDKNKENIRQGCVLDVETTGLGFESKVIEIALLPFQYDRNDGIVVKVLEGYSSFNDPGIPIPTEIENITGINDEMVSGKTIDIEHCAKIINSSGMIIAHNASFDRPFVDRLIQNGKGPEARKYAQIPHYWGCSWLHVDWKSKGYTSAKLELLNIYHGFFVDSHRATTDVMALLHLLTHFDSNTGMTYLDELRKRMLSVEVQITALNSNYDMNPLLKQKGYHWNGQAKQWRKIVMEEDIGEEKEWLIKHIYGGKFKGITKRVHPAERFKWSDK